MILTMIDKFLKKLDPIPPPANFHPKFFSVYFFAWSLAIAYAAVHFYSYFLGGAGLFFSELFSFPILFGIFILPVYVLINMFFSYLTVGYVLQTKFYYNEMTKNWRADDGRRTDGIRTGFNY